MVLSSGAPVSGKKYTRNVAIVLWNGAEILDWGGPAEVFQAAASFGSTDDSPAFHVYTVSKTREPITSQSFIEVTPNHSIDDAPRPDIVVLPGGGVGSVRKDESFLSWCTSTAKDAEIALSVCTGAFVLGDAGLLDGKEVTTWYGAIDGLAEAFPKATISRGRRFIDNGAVVTTAGVSAGIDGALHVVARLLGKHVADRTAEYMEYRWAPEPYLGKDYPMLNPSLDDKGRRAQLAGICNADENFDEAIQVDEAKPVSSN